MVPFSDVVNPWATARFLFPSFLTRLFDVSGLGQSRDRVLSCFVASFAGALFLQCRVQDFFGYVFEPTPEIFSGHRFQLQVTTHLCLWFLITTAEPPLFRFQVPRVVYGPPPRKHFPSPDVVCTGLLHGSRLFFPSFCS